MPELLHIVCLDAPAPPDYGGAIDQFYKIRALAETGTKILLHYFRYNDRDLSAIKPYCAQIHAYGRKITLPLKLPYIVSSRINQELIERLNADKYPVLLEGIHCTGIIPFLNDQRRVVVRIHNDEASYYKRLALLDKSYLKQLYFRWESRLLKQYQKTLVKSLPLACLSQKDAETFRNEYGFKNVKFIPCFLPWQYLNVPEEKGSYCLYHGNMAVSENEEAAAWLIRNVFHATTYPLVIAGRSISGKLEALARHYTNVRLVPDPSIESLDVLVKEAQVHVLPSFNTTGVKLKLLHVLLEGRHCISNKTGVEGSLAEAAVTIAETPEAFIKEIERMFQKEMTAEDKQKRQALLALYDNKVNAGLLNGLW